ncbi:MAG: ABC transporter substrate-binding protein [Coriobacteriia bacterium]|nr:ABC transporter substrate-binding protein [Coriobacteriia bacterium]
MCPSNFQSASALSSTRKYLAVLLVLVIALSGISGGLLLGCNGGSVGEPKELNRQIVIGSMVTEDILPMWVAEDEGIFAEYGLDATVMTFQSAQELSTAVASGSVDLAMTDIMVSATLTASGTPVVMEWVTLGATPAQGRFGILASPESGITSLKDLAGVPIGVGSNTVPEYVMYGLMRNAGIPDDQIVGEEIKKVPVRYEMMASNQVAAAALPGALLTLGEATGMVLVADDSTGENLSQSVMIFREDALANTQNGLLLTETLALVWNDAVNRINANPENYRDLLVEKAQLPVPIQDVYVISEYPLTARPTLEMVTPVLEWMYKKGYLEIELTYNQATGAFKK